MKTALLVFAATYVSVFTLGLQSLNVNQGHYLAAAVTSFFIGTGHIYLYKYMPSAEWAELAGYYAGGIAGITSSIWFHQRAKAWLRGRLAGPRSIWPLPRPQPRPRAALCGRCGLGFSIACWRIDCPRHDDVH